MARWRHEEEQLGTCASKALMQNAWGKWVPGPCGCRWPISDRRDKDGEAVLCVCRHPIEPVPDQQPEPHR